MRTIETLIGPVNEAEALLLKEGFDKAEQEERTMMHFRGHAYTTHFIRFMLRYLVQERMILTDKNLEHAITTS